MRALIPFALAFQTAFAMPCENELLNVHCRGQGCLETSLAEPADKQLPEDPGHLVNGGQRFTLDRGTWSDTDAGSGFTKGVIDPLIAQIPTALGRERLRWEIERPLLDAQLIRARAKAVEVLRTKRGLLPTLGRQFKGESHPEFQNTLEALNRLNSPEIFKGISGDASVLLQNFIGAMVPLGIVYELQAGVVFCAGLTHLVMYLGREYFDQPGFEEAYKLVRLFEQNNKRMVRILKETSDPVLWQIAHTLERAHDPLRPDTLAPIRKQARRALTRHHLLFIPSFLAMTKATRRMGEEIDNLAEYLDALSELELLMGLARFQNQNDSTHKTLQVRDSHEGIISMDQAHNPAILAQGQGPTTRSIPNQFRFDPEHRVELVTGANAMGKTTGLRTEIQLMIASQIGASVPAEGSFSPMILISGNKVNDTLGTSLMMAQSQRVAAMLRAAVKLSREGYRVMLKFDEPFDGTSPEERRALVAAIVLFIESQPNLYASIATHERSLVQLLQDVKTVRRVHYDNFTKKDGGAVDGNAIGIAGKMGVPEEVLEIARSILAKGS